MLAVTSACGQTEQTAGLEPKVAAQVERVRQELSGPIYYLGNSFAELPLTHAESTAPDSAFFVYGTCDASDGGCAPPVQVQQTRIASPARYDTPWRGCVRTTVRGVPAAQFDGFEVYTGDVLVKIYARSFSESKEAAAALRPLGAGDSSGMLPAPVIDLEQPLRECALESLPAKLAELRRHAKAPLYWVGRAFEGHPLARAEGDGQWARFLYGACVPPAPTDAGCWPPLTVEVQQQEQFHPSAWHPSITCTILRVRGAPGALVPRAHELVLFTAHLSLRLQGEDLDLLRRSADALRTLDEPTAPARLPPPPAALEQELQRTCAG